MSRGAAAEEGAERWSNNGYHYTKHNGSWQLTHRMLMEQQLGRPLLPNERVVFVNGNKRDLRIENLKLTTIKTDRSRLMKRKIAIEDKIREYQALLDDVKDELAKLEAQELGVSS